MFTNQRKNHVIDRRHPEWAENQVRWRWLLDSLEGGERYRNAIYGYDSRGMPIRNLVRHKREYPDTRDAMDTVSSLVNGVQATDDDYELRRVRTPVPTFVAEAVDTHLARIYSREVKREGPELIRAWWSNVDGLGTTMDQWMSGSVAPLMLVLGQIDIWIDAAADREGASVAGESQCVASYILPENMLWWRLDALGNYTECLVQEVHDDPERGDVVRYRHWTDTRCVLYDEEGTELEVYEHNHGRVPIVRLFDQKKPRSRNVGQSRYEGVAERQKEYYNRDSELILSDTTQAHPLLQAPEDYLTADGSIPIGPSWLLPKKKNVQSNSTTYEGFDVVHFPKDGAASIRQNKADLRDDIDRDSSLIRPATQAGEAQSGLAKQIDHRDSNHRLIKIAKVLARAEIQLSTLACQVLGVDLEEAGTGAIITDYPADYDLLAAGEIAVMTAGFQDIVSRAGALPESETIMVQRLFRLCMSGLTDQQYQVCDAEIARVLRQKSGNITGASARAEDQQP